MTRKHYESIARVVRETESHTIANDSYRVALAHRFADVFAAENPRFDRERFLRACGLEV